MTDLRSSINVIRKSKKKIKVWKIISYKYHTISKGSQGKHFIIWWIRYEGKNIIKDKEGEYVLVSKQ